MPSRFRKNNPSKEKLSNKFGDKKKSGNGNDRLTPKQRRFADLWLADPDRNGTRAYRNAYPRVKKDSSAAARASALLKEAKIRAYVDARLEKLSSKCLIDQEWVLERYRRLTEFCVDDFFYDDGRMKPFNEIPRDKLYAVGGFKMSEKIVTDNDMKTIERTIREFKFPNKKDVLDSIGRYLGMFAKDNEQTKRQGTNIEQVNIQVNLVE
jgi:phage terminase small subunit